MLFRLTRKLFSPRKGKSARGEANGEAPPATMPKRAVTPEWERRLTAPLIQNSLAPSEDVIQHCYDLYKEGELEPSLERYHRASGLYADLFATVAKLQALVPGLIRQAMSQNRFEFSHILDHKEIDQ